MVKGEVSGQPEQQMQRLPSRSNRLQTAGESWTVHDVSGTENLVQEAQVKDHDQDEGFLC